MERLVVTASGTQPIADEDRDIRAKSASAIMVVPAIVPPGRSERAIEMLADAAAAEPDVFDAHSHSRR